MDKNVNTLYPDDWADVQMDLRDGIYGEWDELKSSIIAELMDEHKRHGESTEVSPEEINRAVYAKVKAGDWERKLPDPSYAS